MRHFLYFVLMIFCLQEGKAASKPPHTLEEFNTAMTVATRDILFAIATEDRSLFLLKEISAYCGQVFHAVATQPRDLSEKADRAKTFISASKHTVHYQGTSAISNLTEKIGTIEHYSALMKKHPNIRLIESRQALGVIYRTMLFSNRFVWQEVRAGLSSGILLDIEDKEKLKLQTIVEGVQSAQTTNTVYLYSTWMQYQSAGPIFGSVIYAPCADGLFIAPSAISVPMLGKPQSQWLAKTPGQFQYTPVDRCMIQDDGGLENVIQILDLNNKNFISSPGIFFEILPPYAQMRFNEDITDNDKPYHIVIRAFDGKTLSSTLLMTSKYYSLQENNVLSFNTVSKDKVDGLLFIKGPADVSPLTARVFSTHIHEIITAGREDDFLPLSVPAPDDIPYFLLDIIDQAIIIQQSQPVDEADGDSAATSHSIPRIGEEREILALANSIREELGVESLKDARDLLKAQYAARVRAEQDAISERVASEQEASLADHLSKGNAKARGKNTKTSHKDGKQPPVSQANGETKAQKAQRAIASDNEIKTSIEKKLRSYLGDGKRTTYKNLCTMINYAKHHGALQETQTSTKGSHRTAHQSGAKPIAAGVPHGGQKEGAMMAINSRMIENLIEGLASDMMRFLKNK